MNQCLSMDEWLRDLAHDGFTIVPGVFSPADVDALAQDIGRALAEPTAATAIRTRNDVVYAARNVLELCPRAASAWRQPPLLSILDQALGPRFGLVRGLYFDKPPERTWALPWHKDMTIAVRAQRRPPAPFSKPTTKAGVAHVEATLELLVNMLTLRIHLDDVTEANGPMRVIPGSHLSGVSMDFDETRRQSILVRKGDVLAIRPLVAHASAASHLDNQSHRRILHLEFAAGPELPGGYAWHTFIPGNSVQE